MPQEKLFNATQAARLLGIHRETWRRWCNEGRLPKPVVEHNKGGGQTLKLYTLEQVSKVKGKVESRKETASAK